MFTLKPAGAVAGSLVVLAGLAGSAASVTAASADDHAGRDNSGRVKNVIYLLGDGMGRTHVTAARERYYGADGHLVMETLPVDRPGLDLLGGEEVRPAGRARTSSPNYVTDSASAATAWASGVKTYNAALGVDAKGNASCRR